MKGDLILSESEGYQTFTWVRIKGLVLGGKRVVRVLFIDVIDDVDIAKACRKALMCTSKRCIDDVIIEEVKQDL